MRWTVPAAIAGSAALGALLWWRYQPRPLPPFQPRILIGDSLAVGLRPHLLKLGTIRRSEIVPQEGTTLAEWLTRNLPRGPYLISLGTNDMAGRGVTAAMVEQMNTRLGDTIWLLPPPMPTLARYGEVIDTIRRNARVIAPPEGLPRAADRIHLPPAGYEQWARVIDNVLRGTS